jgi:hypothetical protein
MGDTDWGALAKAGAEIAAAAAASRAKGRAAEGTANQAQDRGVLDRYSAEQLAKLGGARILEDATQDRADRFLTDSQKRAQQVGLGDLLANVQDVSLGGMPSYIPHMSFSGGLRPSALGPNARQAGRSLSQQALEAQLSGSDIPNLPDVSQLGTPAPGVTPLPQSGKLDKLLEVLGYAGAGYGAYDEATKDKPPVIMNQRMPATQGGMTVPSASAGGIPGTQPALANRADITRIAQLLQTPRGSGG